MSIIDSDDEDTDVDLDETITVEGEVVWVHGQNQSISARPTNVVVQLYNGETLVASTTVSGSVVPSGSNYAASWPYSFANVPKYNSEGTAIVYTVKLSDEIANYETTYSADGRTITNSYTGTTTINHTFKHIDVRISDNTKIELVYTDENGNVIERKEIFAYVTAVHSVIINGTEYTNFVKDNRNYEFRKTNGVSISLASLNANSTAILNVDLKDQNSDATFPNVTITLGLGGIMAAAYDCNGYRNNRFDGLDFTVGTVKNYQIKISTQSLTIDVKKQIQPEGGNAVPATTMAGEFQFQLVESVDDAVTDSAVVSIDNEGKASFKLAFSSGDVGKTFYYTLTEVSGSNAYKDNDQSYSFSVTVTKEDNGSGGIKIIPTLIGEDSYTFTNVYETVNVTVAKEWNDDGDRDSIRPKSVSVQLYADGDKLGNPVTLSEGNWSYTWNNLYKYNANGVAISYTAKETSVPDGYKADINANDNVITITNNHTPALHDDITVTKAWDDNDDQDGIRPNSVQVQLYAQPEGGEEVPYLSAVTLSAANGWKYTWTNLPKYSNGKEIKYTFKELNVPTGYKAIADVDKGTLTNSHTPAVTAVTVTKKWDDNDDQDGIRPDSVQVQLYAQPEGGEKAPYLSAVTLSAANGWNHTWTNLPKYSNGKEITYTFEEVNPSAGYSVIADVAKGILTNSHTPAVMDVTVTKKWDDKDNQDGIRPKSITVQLKANGEKVGEEVTLSAAGNWEYTWKNLPVNANGDRINYTVVEVSKHDGYESSVNGLVITNTHKTETITKSVVKHWNDNDNQDGIRTKFVTVYLLADGNVIDTVQLNAENDWSYEWKNLDAKKNGTYIQYTVKEEAVKGYIGSQSENNNVITLTNTHTPELVTSKVVTKEWDDDDDREGARPSSVSVQLLANGEPYGEAIELNEENNWTGSWTKLPKNSAGKAIDYTFEENPVEGYEPSYDFEKGIITNTYVAGSHLTDVTVKKVWDDGNDFDGIRPESVTVQLLANGEPYGDPAVLSEDSGWEAAWIDLFVNEGGEPIEYTIEELDVAEGYIATVGELKDGVILLTNTHEYDPNTVTKTVTKLWDDNDDSRKLRPKSVKVQLYVNGKACSEVVELTANGGWTYTWEELPSVVDGEPAVYTVKEVDVPDGYYAKYSDDTFTITNVYNIIPKTGNESGSWMWWLLAAFSAMVIAIVLPMNPKSRKHRAR